MMIRKDKQEN